MDIDDRYEEDPPGFQVSDRHIIEYSYLRLL